MLFPTDEDFDLLAWWKNNQDTFPRLSKLAKRILCISATSAASERNFSDAGRTVEKRRTRLNPKTIDDISYYFYVAMQILLTLINCTRKYE